MDLLKILKDTKRKSKEDIGIDLFNGDSEVQTVIHLKDLMEG